MISEIALKEAFIKIKDEFSFIKGEIERLNSKIDEVVQKTNHVEEYRKELQPNISVDFNKKVESSKIKNSINPDEINIKVDEIIDADSYY